MDDLELLARDKYEGDSAKVTPEDRRRLSAGEPLAYVIGWVPFLGLRIDLASRPLIPRPETEWWTEQLIAHVREMRGTSSVKILDLCAGSGAIGLSLLKALPNAYVSFGEIAPQHCRLIQRNLLKNGLDAARAEIRESDLFEAFENESWDFIATNPPYVPAYRITELDLSVTEYEPHDALFSGEDGLDTMRRIIDAIPQRLPHGGELWMECDIQNIDEAERLLRSEGETTIMKDQYNRARVLRLLKT